MKITLENDAPKEGKERRALILYGEHSERKPSNFGAIFVSSY